MYHIASAPHALHILILAHIYAYTGRLCRAKDGNLIRASPMDVRMSTSVKLRGTNIVVIKACPGAFNQCHCLLF
jgi:hypothetical protein